MLGHRQVTVDCNKTTYCKIIIVGTQYHNYDGALSKSGQQKVLQLFRWNASNFQIKLSNHVITVRSTTTEKKRKYAELKPVDKINTKLIKEKLN